MGRCDFKGRSRQAGQRCGIPPGDVHRRTSGKGRPESDPVSRARRSSAELLLGCLSRRGRPKGDPFLTWTSSVYLDYSASVAALAKSVERQDAAVASPPPRGLLAQCGSHLAQSSIGRSSGAFLIAGAPIFAWSEPAALQHPR